MQRVSPHTHELGKWFYACYYYFGTPIGCGFCGKHHYLLQVEKLRALNLSTSVLEDDIFVVASIVTPSTTLDTLSPTATAVPDSDVDLSNDPDDALDTDFEDDGSDDASGKCSYQ